MTVFTWLVVLLLLAALLLGGNVKGNKKFIIVAFVLLFCVYGLRDAYSVGNDSASSYLHGFQYMENTEWSEVNGKGEDNFNIGFAYLMKLGYEITDGDYQLFIAALSVFTMIAYARFIKKYSPSPLQSVLYFMGLLYYTFMFCALKQALAMSILLFAFDAIMDRKPVKFIILVLIASTVHFPAMAFMPAYWIARIKINRSYIFLLAMLLVATYLFRDQILRFMLDSYGSDDMEATMSGVVFLRNKVIIMIIIVVASMILRPMTSDDTVYTTLLKYAGVAIVFQTFCGYNNTFERLADYYFHFSIVLIPLVFEKCDLQRRYLELKTENMIKTIAPILFCSFAIWRFVNYANSNASFSNYIFFFQNTMQ